MKKIVFSVLFLPALALSTDWIVIGITENSVYWIDKASMKKNQVWVRKNYLNPEVKYGEIANYDISKWEIRCNGSKTKISQITYYQDNGNVINSIDFSRERFVESIPGSIGATINNYVCANGADSAGDDYQKTDGDYNVKSCEYVSKDLYYYYWMSNICYSATIDDRFFVNVFFEKLSEYGCISKVNVQKVKTSVENAIMKKVGQKGGGFCASERQYYNSVIMKYGLSI